MDHERRKTCNQILLEVASRQQPQHHAYGRGNSAPDSRRSGDVFQRKVQKIRRYRRQSRAVSAAVLSGGLRHNSILRRTQPNRQNYAVEPVVHKLLSYADRRHFQRQTA